MEKKRFVVRFTYTAQFDAENDLEALRDATYAVQYGIKTIRSMELKVVAALPLPTEARTPAPVEVSSVEEAPLPEAEVLPDPRIATDKLDIPF